MYNLEDIGYNTNIFIRGNDISYLCNRKRGSLVDCEEFKDKLIKATQYLKDGVHMNTEKKCRT